MAEWSKALRLGRNLFGGVGSNPTGCTNAFGDPELFIRKPIVIDTQLNVPEAIIELIRKPIIDRDPTINVAEAIIELVRKLTIDRDPTICIPEVIIGHSQTTCE